MICSRSHSVALRFLSFLMDENPGSLGMGQANNKVSRARYGTSPAGLQFPKHETWFPSMKRGRFLCPAP